MKARGDPLPAAAGSERDGRACTALWGKTPPEGPSLFHGAGAPQGGEPDPREPSRARLQGPAA